MSIAYPKIVSLKRIKNSISCLLILLLSVVSSSEIQDASAIFPRLPIGVTNISANSSCRKDSELYLKELKNMTIWATRMWDATAKSTNGILTGNIYHLGDFHECIETNAPFATQYCLATIVLHVPDNYSGAMLQRFIVNKNGHRNKKNFIQIAWCIPASCSAEEAQTSLKKYLENRSLSVQGVTYSATISDEDCQTHENVKLDRLDVIFCVLTAVLLIFVVAATLFDYYSASDDTYLAVTAFSAKKNLSNILRTEQSTDHLTVLHGIRTIASLCVFVAHSFVAILMGGAIKNFDKFDNLLYGNFSLWNSFIYHGDVDVDTFFTISGILVAYSVFKFTESTPLQPWKIILYRYLRLTPLYAYLLLYYSTLLNISGSGSLWKRLITSQRTSCRANWYSNLFYLQNYIQDASGQFCMIHTWSLACDFHFFLIALFIYFAIIHRKKLGLLLLYMVPIASVLTTFLKVYSERLPALLHVGINFMEQPEFQEIYIKSHLRAAPYFIGLYAGYLHYRFCNTKSRLNLIQSGMVLTFCFLLFSGVLCCAGVFFNPDREYNAFESAMYASLNRIVWSLGIVGIIFVAIYGSLPLLNKILSWKLWIPFSKLTYAAYLGHFHYHIRRAAVATSPFEYNLFDFAVQGLCDCLYIFVNALVLHLLIEAPFNVITKKVLFSGIKNKMSTIKETTAMKDKEN